MMRNKKLNVFLPLLFALVMILGMYLGFQLSGTLGRGRVIFSTHSTSSLQEILNLIKIKYVDTVNITRLNQKAIETILSELDPHSVYIPPSELQDVNNDLEGNFQGIGVEFNIIHDTVNVTSVIPGGPSDVAGILIGDQFIRVNDSLVVGPQITPNRIKQLLRGPKDSQVRVMMLRNGQQKQFTIRRGVIPLYSVEASYLLAPQIGYIKLSKFSATTYDEFMKALRGLQQQGMKKLVIDLRQNPGGFLDAATRVADELLDDQKLIVYTKGKNYPRSDYRCEKPGLFEKGPLAILTDEGSASASEVLAGAIQDWDRGIIIGRRTFGKGLVQEQYDLNDGGALRLTVARYYIPSGRCIQKPYNHGVAAYEDDIMNRFTHGEFVSKDSIKVTDTTQYHTAKGRTVYGGGGITPDIFIPFDTTRVNGIFTELYSHNTLSDFAYRYFSEHRNDFRHYQSAADFNQRFILPNNAWEAFINYATADNIASIRKIGPREAALIQQRLKALLARQLWRNEGFYLVSNTDDLAIKKAVEELNKYK